MAETHLPRDVVARHALMDRRVFLRRAALAAAAGSTGLLAACVGDGSTASPTSAPGPDATLPRLPWDPDQPYWMQGGFAPVATETTATGPLEVTGALPPELTGLYVRNGSNPASGPSPHWFLGDGMVHGVRLERGTAAWYRNRYVDTPMYRERRGLLGGGGPGGANNQSNVSVFHHGGRLLSSGEVGFPYELSTEDLSTIGPYDFGGRLTTAMTAHPKIDPATGRLHFFGYGFTVPFLTYHVADVDGTLITSEAVAVGRSTMMHDFAITDRDVVFWELPVVFDMEAAMRMVTPGTTPNGRPNSSQFPYRWDPSYGARIGVMPLGGPTSAIRWVEIPPCFVFHGTNAWREGDDVVLDVCVLPRAFGDGNGGDLGVTTPHRWRVGTAGPSLTFSDEVLTDRAMDLPAIDRRRTGRANAQAWYLLVDPLDDFQLEFSGIGRRDAATGRMDQWLPGPGLRPNEGCFVPASPTSAEGEGWLLTFAWDRARDAGDLVVLDALDLARGPVARVHLPARVPYGFHGSWVPGEA